MCLILIVEDEARLAAFVEKGLRQNGFNTRVIGDGEQALKEARSQPFDLMILDLGLPKVNGWGVLQELKRLGNVQPVIVMTAETDARKVALEAGAQDYIPKPFRFQDLLTAIKAQLA
ncbi:MAG: response regulator transcription factor [Acaryochloridaceae cyanobacterium SU_2_1]|nr:response regulator transcription factor [Acaryochloridaceae cyanobacterium SU_2_1]